MPNATKFPTAAHTAEHVCQTIHAVLAAAGACSHTHHKQSGAFQSIHRSCTGHDNERFKRKEGLNSPLALRVAQGQDVDVHLRGPAGATKGKLRGCCHKTAYIDIEERKRQVTLLADLPSTRTSSDTQDILCVTYTMRDQHADSIAPICRVKNWNTPGEGHAADVGGDQVDELVGDCGRRREKESVEFCPSSMRRQYGAACTIQCSGDWARTMSCGHTGRMWVTRQQPGGCALHLQ